MHNLRPPRELDVEAPTPPSDNHFQPPQFGLREMFIVTTAIAVYFALDRLINIFGLVIVFAVFVFAWFTRRGGFDHHSPRTQLVLDLLSGVLLPMGCLEHDPFLFTAPVSRFIGFASIGSQILALASWMIVAPMFGPWAFGFYAGFLMFGAAAALAIGGLLSPLALAGLFMLIGILGFIPFFTAATYFRHSRSAKRFGLAGQEGRIAWWTGFTAALAVPFLAAVVTQYLPAQWLELIGRRGFGIN
jgi:hypothetical protein